MRVERVGERVDALAGRERGDREHGRRAGAERAERRAQVVLGAAGGRAEVGLGDDEHVGDLHDPGLEELQRVAGAGLDDDGDGVRGLGDVGLGLADADGLDHDDVERGRERLRGRAGRGREAAEPLAGGHRADEHVAVGGVVLDPRAVAEQRAAASAWTTGRPRARRRRGRARATRAAARDSSVDLPTPGGPVTPTTWPAPSPRGGRRSAAASVARGRASRAGSSAAGAARRGRRAAQPRAELALAAHAAAGDAVARRHQRDDVAHDPVELEVLRRVDRGDARRLAAPGRRRRG